MTRSGEPGSGGERRQFGGGQQQWWECRLNRVSSCLSPLLAMETEAKEEEGIITGNLVFDPCVVKKGRTEEQRQSSNRRGFGEREREVNVRKEMDP